MKGVWPILRWNTGNYIIHPWSNEKEIPYTSIFKKKKPKKKKELIHCLTTQTKEKRTPQPLPLAASYIIIIIILFFVFCFSSYTSRAYHLNLTRKKRRGITRENGRKNEMKIEENETKGEMCREIKNKKTIFHHFPDGDMKKQQKKRQLLQSFSYGFFFVCVCMYPSHMASLSSFVLFTSTIVQRKKEKELKIKKW